MKSPVTIEKDGLAHRYEVDADSYIASVESAARQHFCQGATVRDYGHESWGQAMWMEGDAGPFTADFQATVGVPS